MPSAVFYPTVGTEPVAGEGSFIEGMGATVWTNITTKFNFDSDSDTDDGSLSPPGSGIYAPAADDFAYTATGSIGVAGFSRMFRLGTWKRLSDDTAIETVLASASAVSALTLDIRTSDADMGLTGVSSAGVNTYYLQFQQRTSGGAFGSVVTSSNFFDYAASGLYFYRTNPIATFAATLPSVAQITGGSWALNGRMGFNGDVYDNSPDMGFNGVRMTLTWTEPSATSTRVRPSRSRNRIIG